MQNHANSPRFGPLTGPLDSRVKFVHLVQDPFIHSNDTELALAPFLDLVAPRAGEIGESGSALCCPTEVPQQPRSRAGRRTVVRPPRTGWNRIDSASGSSAAALASGAALASISAPWNADLETLPFSKTGNDQMIPGRENGI